MSVKLIKIWLCHVFPGTRGRCRQLRGCQLPASDFGKLVCLWPCSMEVSQTAKSPPPPKDNCADICCCWCAAFVVMPKCAFCGSKDVVCWHTGRSSCSRVLQNTQHFDLLSQCLYKIMTYFLARGVHNPNDRMLGVLEVSWWGILILLCVSLHGFRGLIAQMIASLRGAERASQLSPEREYWTTLCQAKSPSTSTEMMSELS